MKNKYNSISAVLAPYIDGVYTLTFSHLMIEVNATDDDFCISFRTLRRDGKYIKEFLQDLIYNHL